MSSTTLDFCVTTATFQGVVSIPCGSFIVIMLKYYLTVIELALAWLIQKSILIRSESDLACGGSPFASKLLFRLHMGLPVQNRTSPVSAIKPPTFLQ